MFRRGGGVSAKNNGIVSGFDNGGTVRQGFTNGTGPEGAQTLEEVARNLYAEPTRQQGLTASDYLRIAAAGAQIMGAQPTGRSGVIGALQAAAPALSGLGMDLATSSAERDASFKAKQEARDAFIRQAALTDKEKQLDFEMQKDLAAIEFDYSKGLQEIVNQGKLDVEAAKVPDIAVRLELAAPKQQELSILLAQKAQTFDSLGPSEKASMLNRIAALNSEISQIMDDAVVSSDLDAEAASSIRTKANNAAISDLTSQGKIEAGSKPGPGDPAFAEYIKLKDDYEQYYTIQKILDLTPGFKQFADTLADGGRVGFAEGDRVTRAGDNEEKAAEDAAALARAIEQENKKKNFRFFVDKDGVLRKMPVRAGDNEEQAARDAAKMFSGPQREVPGPQRFERAEGGVMTTMTDEPSPQKESPLTFEELRARLPMEVTDSVVRLLSSSEAALLDFANINTEQDIAVFNQKYNTDLQLPTQAV